MTDPLPHHPDAPVHSADHPLPKTEEGIHALPPTEAKVVEAMRAALPETELPGRKALEAALKQAEHPEGPVCVSGVPMHPQRTGWMLFCPHRLVDSVTEIKAEELKARCIEGVILDLDNTLVLWQQEEMTEAIVGWLNHLKAAEIRMCILSNSVMSNRSQRIGERLGCPYVRQARKPSRSGFHRAMALMGTSPASTSIVGDQMFTDILGGNRSGLYTIMVRPLQKHEFPYTRYVSRPPEKLLLKWFKRRGSL